MVQQSSATEGLRTVEEASQPFGSCHCETHGIPHPVMRRRWSHQEAEQRQKSGSHLVFPQMWTRSGQPDQGRQTRYKRRHEQSNKLMRWREDLDGSDYIFKTEPNFIRCRTAKQLTPAAQKRRQGRSQLRKSFTLSHVCLRRVLRTHVCEYV